MKNLIIVSDTHVNSSVGLSIPEVKLDDGGLYTTSKSQDWLLKCFSDFYKTIKDLDGEKILILNGDIIDLNKHNKYQLITENTSVAINHSVTLHKLLTDLCDKTYLIRGTEAHVGNVAEYEELIGGKLDTIQDDNGNYSWWKLFINVDGVIFDITHHGVVGQKAWTKTHPLDSLAANTIIEATRSGGVQPDVIIRSHLHTYADTYDNYPVRVIQTPAWQLSTAHAYRIGAGVADIGGLIFRCDNGEYDLIKKLYKPEPQKPMVI